MRRTIPRILRKNSEKGHLLIGDTHQFFALDANPIQSIYSGYMEKTLLNVKTDRKLKRDAQKVAQELGLPLGTIINAYLKELIREKRVVFSEPPAPNVRTQKLLRRIVSDRIGRDSRGPFTYEEAIRYLDAR